MHIQKYAFVSVLLVVFLLVLSPGALGVASAAGVPKLGDSGDEVLALQRRLQAMGDYIAPIDDQFGRHTALSISHYQARMGDKSTGVLTKEQYARLFDENFSTYLGDLQLNDQSPEVLRVQIRLDLLGYLKGSTSGQYDTETGAAVASFQRANNLTENGVADEPTQKLLFSEAAVPAEYPAFQYRLFVNTNTQRVFAYQWSDGGYNERVLMAICSTGLDETPTPKGVFRSGGQVSSWCYFPIYRRWARYAYRIEGPILFHSVLYDGPSEQRLDERSKELLGTKTSHGCIRLELEDVQWIYDHCEAGTTVVVY